MEQAAGIAYSIPYDDDGAIGGMVRSRELAQSVQARLQAATQAGEVRTRVSRAFEGVRVAVPGLRSSPVYAKEHLAMYDVVLCDLLPAAYESQNPPVDVILEKLPTRGWMQEFYSRHLREPGSQALFCRLGGAPQADGSITP